MKRRDFLKTGLKIGVAANALPLMLGGMPVRALGRSPLRRALEASGGANNNVLVIIQLQGGNDGLNCVVPYADPNFISLRPTIRNLDASTLLKLGDHDTLAFHSAMTGISTLYGEGKVAVLQNVGYPLPNLSHFRGTDIWQTGTDSSIYASTGWVGRLLYEQNPTYPPQTIPAGSQPLAIQFGNSLSNLFLSANGGMGIAINQVPTKPTGSVHHYDDIPATHATEYDELQYVRIIQSETEVYAQTIVSRSITTNKVTYPTGNTLASQLSSIAQLIASGFQTKVYLVTQGSYDTHSNELTTQGNLLGDLAAAVLAFQQDLEAFGVADRVAMMTYSEFGRRPQENGSGTDHGTAAPHFVIGTQVNGGVMGQDPNLSSSALVAGNLAYDTNHDFRNIYASVMNEWLLAGGDQTQINTDIHSVLTSDANGTYSTMSSWNASLGIFKGSQSAVNSNAGAMGLMLMQNYPNPVYGVTSIEYALPATGPVQLGLYNTAGIEIERMVDGNQDAGPHRQSFDTSRLPSGAYLYRLTTASGNIARQMIVER